MTVSNAVVAWERGSARFTDNRYSRAHRWELDGGLTIPASSSPQVVRVPLSDPHGIDPEEALVAAISSCHMLWFLSIAAPRGFVVDSYRDEAAGTLERISEGKMAMTKAVLRPRIAFSGEKLPDSAALASMHEEAHEKCFIANSVRTAVTVEPRA